MIKGGNLFAGIPAELPEELAETLATGEGLRIERTVSRGHSSPTDFWYDQEQTEWVVLLSGSAVIHFQNGSVQKVMRPGDWLEIPARCRHRVEATAGDDDSVWLAVHWG